MVTRLVTLHTSLTATATETLPRVRPEALAPRSRSTAIDPLRGDDMRVVLRAGRARSS